jgi:hypothetical protein
VAVPHRVLAEAAAGQQRVLAEVAAGQLRVLAEAAAQQQALAEAEVQRRGDPPARAASGR